MATKKHLDRLYYIMYKYICIHIYIYIQDSCTFTCLKNQVLCESWSQYYNVTAAQASSTEELEARHKAEIEAMGWTLGLVLNYLEGN